MIESLLYSCDRYSGCIKLKDGRSAHLIDLEWYSDDLELQKLLREKFAVKVSVVNWAGDIELQFAGLYFDAEVFYFDTGYDHIEGAIY